jgi:hypothetical protein
LSDQDAPLSQAWRLQARSEIDVRLVVASDDED